MVIGHMMEHRPRSEEKYSKVINGTDRTFLHVAWQFNTGKMRIDGKETARNFEKLFSSEWTAKLGAAIADPEQRAKVDSQYMARLLSSTGTISPFTIHLLLFGGENFREFIHEANLTRDEEQFVCGEILFEFNSDYIRDHSLANAIIYYLHRERK